MHNEQYSDKNTGAFNWSYQFKEILKYYGFEHIWYNRGNNKSKIIHAFINKVKERFRTYWHKYFEDQRNENGKMYRYADFKADFGLAYHLKSISNFHIRKVITRIRICDLKIEIETLRYARPKIERCNRLCRQCDMKVVEDEEHFLMVCDCDKLKTLRDELLPEIVTENYTFYDLLSSENDPILYRLGKFINRAMKIRLKMTQH